MFGCCVAGRLLQTNLQQIDETHVTFSIADVSTVNHIVVFLLGTIPFPEGYAATVHFAWPGKGFQLLGLLSNEKPSAVFRVRGTESQTSMGSQAINHIDATIGISVEPMQMVQAQIATLPTSSMVVGASTNAGVDPTYLAERIVTHLFNHLSSYGDTVGPNTMIPLGVIQRWYDSFLNKLRAGGAGFLTKTE